MDKNQPNDERNLVEWARPYLSGWQRFYRLIDPHLKGGFPVKSAQKAIQLAGYCLDHDPKARPLMTEVVEALKSLPHQKDMAYLCSSYFEAIQEQRVASNPRARAGSQIWVGFVRNMPKRRFVGAGPHASPSQVMFQTGASPHL